MVPSPSYPSAADEAWHLAETYLTSIGLPFVMEIWGLLFMHLIMVVALPVADKIWSLDVVYITLWV